MSSLPVICLLGPTASGKTHLAIELVQKFPLDIISVDSAMVYREMNIGTAKPDKYILNSAPHRLIDCVDPSEVYSAGRFCEEALEEINKSLARGRIPFLVGGTMLYFRALQCGLAKLPKANHELRNELSDRANREGWEVLHNELKKYDPKAAERIHEHDGIRIARALEVYYTTGIPLSEWQQQDIKKINPYHFYQLGILPSDRINLHKHIALRFKNMLTHGLIEEVQHLYNRGDLHTQLPSIRSVNYRQIWSYLKGEINHDQMCEQAVAATRQLAKRQITWLRTWPDLNVLEDEEDKKEKAIRLIDCFINERLPIKS